jgi:uncharacterized Tic20 family protein
MSSNNPFEDMTDDVFEQPIEEMEDNHNQYHQSNQPDAEERQMAMFTHLAALAGYIIPFGNVVGPLILWSMKKEQMPLVDKQGKDSINFQISMTIYMIVAALLSMILIGIPILIGLAIYQFIAIIIATVKVSNGQNHKYPITIEFLK